jgi:hypothetical protein
MNTAEHVEEGPLPRRAEPEQLNLTALRSSVTDLEQQARAFIRQRPVVAVLAAVGAGYLVARLVSRARR